MTVVLNKFYSTRLMHSFFLIDDEEISAGTMRETKGSVGGGGGGWVGGGRKAFIKKGISLLPLLAMETVMNPLCNAFLSVARRVYRS